MKILLVLLFALTTQAKVLNFETARLKSTGGAGVASLLMNEATISNPAPLAFFNMGAIYFEKFSADHKVTTKGSETQFDSENYAFIASDSSRNLKGSIAYIKSKNGIQKQKLFNLAFASNLGKQTAGGISYRKVLKEYDYNGKRVKEEYKQLVPGIYHAISREFALGVVAIDPLRKNPKESKVIVGMQYQFLRYISLMLDAGADYKEELSETSVLRAASQVKIFSDFYMRFGAFEDKALKERGSGFGIGWVQPRLVIDFAIKNTKVNEDEILQQNKEDIKETSFSLAYRF
ncbi:MAG: hypothetical protein BM556_08575 [Bacteriovorax sp. MedPE-SWde]|nr:MAG: hypothetical protein BM556_08575 [Bacteriovorax sp. MedPE-SWde]